MANVSINSSARHPEASPRTTSGQPGICGSLRSLGILRAYGWEARFPVWSRMLEILVEGLKHGAGSTLAPDGCLSQDSQLTDTGGTYAAGRGWGDWLW